MACSRCNAGGSCDCFVVAGTGTTVTGSGAAGSPWVVTGVLTPGNSLDVVFDGVNGSTAPPLVANNFVICSPGGGGVPGAPSQAATDYPQCPDSGFPKVYQTSLGLKTGPLKKEFSQLIRSVNDQWPAQPCPLFAAGQDQRSATIHNIVNTECYTLNYFVQYSNHVRAIIAGGPGLPGSAQDYELVYFMIVNGVRNPIRVGHFALRTAVLNGGFFGVNTVSDRIAPGQYISVGALPPAGVMTLQPTWDVTNDCAGGGSLIREHRYDLTIIGVP